MGFEKTKELKTIISERMHKMIQNQEFNISSKLEEYFEETYLKPLNIKYKKQFFLKEIKQYCDFYIQDYNLIIEIDDSIWHCDPRIELYPKHTYQQEEINKDIIKNTYLLEHGFKIIRFWENDIKSNEEYIKRKLDLVFNDSFNSYINSLNNQSPYSFRLLDLINDSDVIYNSTYFKRIKNENPNIIFIYEDEWIKKREITQSRIKNYIGCTENTIYARKCEIREVSSQDTKQFLIENHIQGSTNSKYNYGLFYNNELVSLMTFGSLRKNLGSTKQNDVYELLRFTNKINTTVIGGASKLLKYFINKQNPIKIISYCDRRWSNGNLYKQLGFELSHQSQPNYFYVVGNRRENRFSYRKDILISEGFDGTLTEKQIMKNRNINRIYDCGCDVYELQIQNE